MASSSKPAPASRPYLHNGQVLQSPPFTVRARNFAFEAYNFFGLYFNTIFSLDAYAAAEESQFNLRNRQRSTTAYRAPPRSGPGGRGGGGGGGGGGGSGGSGGGGGGGGKKLGTVDDVRGPECKSCG